MVHDSKSVSGKTVHIKKCGVGNTLRSHYICKLFHFAGMIKVHAVNLVVDQLLSRMSKYSKPVYSNRCFYSCNV